MSKVQQVVKRGSAASLVFELPNNMMRNLLKKKNLSIKNFSISKPLFYSKKSLPQVLIDKTPPKVQPYLYLMRLDKPIGTWLLLLPGLWSISMAKASLIPDPLLFSLFSVGAVLMRGAGCTINDILDRDFDKQVERTKTRPIASGQVSRKEAAAFLVGQLTLSLGILLSLNTYSIVLGAASLLFVFTYPLFKRFTYWPQLMLGFTFNWGAMLGYSAVTGFCNWSVTIPLYIAGISWTLIYDTIYAHQDKMDDQKIGVKSTALLFANRTKEYLTFFTFLFFIMMMISGYYNGYKINESWPYYLSVIISSIHLLYQTHFTDFNNPQQCMKRFISNRWTGMIILSGILIGNYLKK